MSSSLEIDAGALLLELEGNTLVVLVALTGVIIWVVRLCKASVRLSELGAAYDGGHVVRLDGIAPEVGNVSAFSRAQLEQLLRGRQSAPPLSVFNLDAPVVVQKENLKVALRSRVDALAATQAGGGGGGNEDGNGDVDPGEAAGPAGLTNAGTENNDDGLADAATAAAPAVATGEGLLEAPPTVDTVCLHFDAALGDAPMRADVYWGVKTRAIFALLRQVGALAPPLAGDADDAAGDGDVVMDNGMALAALGGSMSSQSAGDLVVNAGGGARRRGRGGDAGGSASAQSSATSSASASSAASGGVRRVVTPGVGVGPGRVGDGGGDADTPPDGVDLDGLKKRSPLTVPYPLFGRTEYVALSPGPRLAPNTTHTLNWEAELPIPPVLHPPPPPAAAASDEGAEAADTGDRPGAASAAGTADPDVDAEGGNEVPMPPAAPMEAFASAVIVLSPVPPSATEPEQVRTADDAALTALEAGSAMDGQGPRPDVEDGPPGPAAKAATTVVPGATGPGAAVLVLVEIEATTGTYTSPAQFLLTAYGALELNPIYGLEADAISDNPRDNECVVCLCDPKDTILMPCRHFCVCHTCFERLDFCPFCRTPVRYYLRYEDGSGDGGAGGGAGDVDGGVESGVDGVAVRSATSSLVNERGNNISLGDVSVVVGGSEAVSASV